MFFGEQNSARFFPQRLGFRVGSQTTFDVFQFKPRLQRLVTKSGGGERGFVVTKATWEWTLAPYIKTKNVSSLYGVMLSIGSVPLQVSIPTWHWTPLTAFNVIAASVHSSTVVKAMKGDCLFFILIQLK